MSISLRSFIVALSVLAGASLWHTPSHAWGYMDADWAYWNRFDSWSQNARRSWELVNEEHLPKRNRKKKASSSSQKKKQAKKQEEKKQEPVINARAFEYKYSPELSRTISSEVMDGMINQGKKGGLGDADIAVLRELAKVDLAGMTYKTLEEKGLKSHSVASAMTFWFIGLYDIAHGGNTGTFDPSGLLKQFQQGLSSDPDMLKMSDADKQRMAENMLWHVVLQKMGVDGMQTAQERQAAAQSARADLLKSGFDINTMKLTDQGMQLK